MKNIIPSVNSIINFLFLLTIGLLPLYFAIFYKDYSVFELDKNILFRIFVLLLLIFCLFKIFKYQKLKIKISKWQIILPSLFILSILLSGIFSVSPHTSFFGHYWRQQGFISYFFYFLFFLFALYSFDVSKRNNKKKLLITLLISSFLVSVYGLAQYLGYDQFEWKHDLLMQRINSSVGQPNFLGAYLLLVIPLLFYSLYFFKIFVSRAIILVVLFLNFFVLLLSSSRSAWVGMVVICFFALIFYLFKKFKKKYFLYFIFALVFIGVMFGFWFFGGSQEELSSPRISDRIRSTFDTEVGSNKLRLEIYRISATLIKKNPWLGYGGETMWLWFPEYYTGEMMVHENINTFFDRTHNELLDIVIFYGLTGLTAYIILVIYLFSTGLKNIFRDDIAEKREDKYLLLSFLLAMVGYLVAIQFGFSITLTNVYFWFYLALIFVLINHVEEVRVREYSFSFKLRKSIGVFAVFVLVFSQVYIVWQFNVKKILADVYFYKAISGVVRGADFGQVNDDFLRVLKYNPNQDYYRAQYADKLLSTVTLIGDCENKMHILVNAENFLNDIPLERMDLNMRFNLLKSRTLIKYCKNELDVSVIKKELAHFIEYSPALPSLRLDIGDLYMAIGENKLAIESFEDALLLYPDLLDKRMNRDHRNVIKGEMAVIYKILADAHRREGNIDEAIDGYEKTIELKGGFINFDLRNNLSDLYKMINDYKKVIEVDEHSLVLSNHDYYYLVRLMQDYHEAGDMPRARDYAEMVIRIDQNNELAQKYLKN